MPFFLYMKHCLQFVHMAFILFVSDQQSLIIRYYLCFNLFWGHPFKIFKRNILQKLTTKFLSILIKLTHDFDIFLYKGHAFLPILCFAIFDERCFIIKLLHLYPINYKFCSTPSFCFFNFVLL